MDCTGRWIEDRRTITGNNRLSKTDRIHQTLLVWEAVNRMPCLEGECTETGAHVPNYTTQKNKLRPRILSGAREAGLPARINEVKEHSEEPQGWSDLGDYSGGCLIWRGEG